MSDVILRFNRPHLKTVFQAKSPGTAQAMAIVGDFPDAIVEEAYSGSVTLVNAVGLSNVRLVSGTLPVGYTLSIDNSLDPKVITITWPEYTVNAAPISNPEFSEGTEGWKFGPGWDTAVDPNTGSNSARYWRNGGSSILSNQAMYLVDPGTTIKAQCIVDQGASSAGNAGAGVRLEFRDPTTLEVVSYKDGNMIMSASGGAVYPSDVEAESPSGSASYVNIACHGIRNRQNLPLWADNFSWDLEVPVAGINTPGTITFTLEATDSIGQVATREMTIEVKEPMVLEPFWYESVTYVAGAGGYAPGSATVFGEKIYAPIDQSDRLSYQFVYDGDRVNYAVIDASEESLSYTTGNVDSAIGGTSGSNGVLGGMCVHGGVLHAVVGWTKSSGSHAIGFTVTKLVSGVWTPVANYTLENSVTYSSNIPIYQIKSVAGVLYVFCPGGYGATHTTDKIMKSTNDGASWTLAYNFGFRSGAPIFVNAVFSGFLCSFYNGVSVYVDTATFTPTTLPAYPGSGNSYMKLYYSASVQTIDGDNLLVRDRYIYNKTANSFSELSESGVVCISPELFYGNEVKSVNFGVDWTPYKYTIPTLSSSYTKEIFTVSTEDFGERRIYLNRVVSSQAFGLTAVLGKE